jgi:uncharacterized membrane protein (TIGR02234 family)
MRSRTEFAAALVLDLLGAGVALLISTRHWQTAHLSRPRPLTDQAIGFTGRNLDSAPTALAVVALAGVVAVLAVRGWARRVVGAVLCVVGAAIVWRSLSVLDPITLEHARELRGRDKDFVFDAIVVADSHISTHSVWPWFSAACGLLIAVSGAMIAVRGHRWVTLSARYEAPRDALPDIETERARAQATMWQSLDRGDDPTDPSAPERDHPDGGGAAPAG